MEIEAMPRASRQKTASSPLNVGDVVRITRVPQAVLDDAPAETRFLFERALGSTFVVGGFDPYGHVELDVSKIEPLNKIWIEAECLSLFRRRSSHRPAK